MIASKLTPRCFHAPTLFTSHYSTKRKTQTRTRRVVFNVPGSSKKMIEKALTLDLDCVVLDLEDGVALNQKSEARNLVTNAFLSNDFGRSEKAIRINSIGTEFFEKDMEAVSRIVNKLDAILVPKVENAQQVKQIHKLLDQSVDEISSPNVKIFACIESPHGLFNLKDICQASHRLDALVFGSEDYAASMGITRSKTGEELLYARSKIVTYANAFNVSAIDMVCIHYKSDEQLRYEAEQGFRMGFSGKQAIHPNQIKPIYDCFEPPSEDIEFALRILKENKEHQSAGSGAWEIDGKMIDAPMVKWAERILSKASPENIKSPVN